MHLDSRGAAGADGQKLTIWLDSSGNNHHAVSTVHPSNATYRLYPGIAAPLISFAPTYNPLKIAAIADDFDEFTIAFSLRPRTLQDYNQRLGTALTWATGFLFHSASNGSVYVGTTIPTRMDPTDLPAGTLQANVLQFFTFTYSAGVGRLYKDGHLLCEKADMTPSSAAQWGSSSGLRIGTLVDGDHGDVLVYSRALSKIEVVDLQDFHEEKFQMALDSDGDGFADRYELRIIHADEGDAYDTLTSISPTDDFDGDGAGNLIETVEGTDPTDATSISRFPHAGLRFWLDSRDIAEAPGQTITQWPDRSGNETFATLANPAYVATMHHTSGFGAPMVRFQGGIDHLVIPSLSGNIPAYSVTWSMMPQNIINYNQTLGTPWGGAFQFHASAGGGLYVGSNVSSRLEPTELPAGSMLPNVLQVYTYTFKDGTGRLFRDGTLIGEKSGLAAPGSWYPFRLGRYVSGDIGEVILHERAISPLEIRNLYNGVYVKYVMTASGDQDGDGIADWWENQYGLDSNDPADGVFDNDNDGLTNFLEFFYGTHPDHTDSDGDGVSDHYETLEGTDPRDASDTPEIEWITLTGDLEPDPDNPTPKRLSRKITIPAGQAKAMIVAIATEEYPFFTGGGGDVPYSWGDILEWKIQAVNYPLIDKKDQNVNAYHDDFHDAEEQGSSFAGFPNAHMDSITVLEAPDDEPLDVFIDLSARNVKDGSRPSTVMIGFAKIGKAPAVLAVNSDFDEGRIDPATGYAIPDCDDMAGVDLKTGAGNTKLELGAKRNHLDGTFTQGEHVVKDLHKGWFGVTPSQLGDNFWAGANVTIRKIDKIDDDTDYKESGQVRFYAKWNGGHYGIAPYDFQTLLPVNLVSAGVNLRPGEGVYGASSTIPDGAEFYMEGVRPGKITLEWRFQKGDIDVKHEQTFQVETRQVLAEWRDEVRYQIRLQTKVKTGNEVDVAAYHPGNGFYDNVRNVQEIYYYYRQLFRQMPEKFMWAGMAKTAAAPIYAGMSDLTEWYYSSEITPGTGFGSRDPGTGFFINGLLLDGQRKIFQDMAWMHRAYRASGIEAIRHTTENESLNPLIILAWNILDEGIRDLDQSKINNGNDALLLREQEIVVQPNYVFIRGIWIRQPPAVAAWWFGATSVPVNADGLANAAEWLTANSKKILLIRVLRTLLLFLHPCRAENSTSS